MKIAGGISFRAIYQAKVGKHYDNTSRHKFVLSGSKSKSTPAEKYSPLVTLVYLQKFETEPILNTLYSL